MRAIVMEGFGGPDKARLGEASEPDLGPSDVLVRVAAASLNPVDWKEMAGMLAAFNPPYPARWTPGFDGAGVVAAVGAAVSAVAPGDRVIVRPDRAHGNGVLAELVRAPEDWVAAMPPGLNFDQAAGLASCARTAWQAFFRSDVWSLERGHSVLVDGAAGGVGSYAVAIANAVGCATAGSCRAASFDYVRSLGADLVVDYRSERVAEQVRQWAPDGLDVVLDTQSGGRKAELLDLLRPDGLLISLATLTNDADVTRMTEAVEAAGRRFHFLLMDYGTLREDIAALTSLLAAGMRLPEVTVYPFEQAVAALEAVKAGGVHGKIAVRVADLD
jgi:NADPH2:quinone reductase